MPQNQFLPFAAGDGANTLAYALYAAQGYLAQGFQNGVAQPFDINTVLRQVTTIAAALGQFTADNQSADVLDDGVPANFEAKFTAALKGVLSASSVHYGVATGTGDAMVVTASPPMVAASSGGYQPGSLLIVKTPNTANTLAAPTVNANSIGNIAIGRRTDAALSVGDHPATSLVMLAFDGQNCFSLGLLPSDVSAIVSAAIAPLQTEITNAVAGAGVTATDPTQLLQALLLSGGLFIGTFGGTPDALTAAIPGGIVVPALKAGMAVRGFIQATNVTASPTLAVAGFTNGAAPAPIKRRGTAAPAIGDLVVSTLVTFRFDGTNWRIDGIVASDLAGLLTTSVSLTGLLKLRLQANTTFYVATTGSDATGLGTQTAPWATIQHALDTVAANYDLNGFGVTIQLADGTYAGALATRPWSGGGAYNVLVQGNVASPANVVVQNTSPQQIAALAANGTGVGFSISSLMLTNTQATQSVQAGLYSGANAVIVIAGSVVFGAATTSHIYASNGGLVDVAAGYTVSGSAQQHWVVTGAGHVAFRPQMTITVTFTGALTFGSTTYASDAGIITFSPTLTFAVSGSVSGQRYAVANGGVIDTFGQGASYVPGSSPGVTSGGYYS